MHLLRSEFDQQALKSDQFYRYNSTTDANIYIWYEARPLDDGSFALEEVKEVRDYYSGDERVFETREGFINFSGETLKNVFTYEQAVKKLTRLNDAMCGSKKYTRLKQC